MLHCMILFEENDEPLVSSTEGKKVEEGTVVTHRKSSVTSLLQVILLTYIIIYGSYLI